MRTENLTPTIFMYEESTTPITWFLDLGIESPNFWPPEVAIFTDFGNKKWDFGSPTPKTENTFWQRELYPKLVVQTPVSGEYNCRASFGQILKIAYCRLYWSTSLTISQSQQPMVLLLKFKILKSSNGCFGFLQRVVFLTVPPLKWLGARPLGNSDTFLTGFTILSDT